MCSLLLYLSIYPSIHLSIYLSYPSVFKLPPSPEGPRISQQAASGHRRARGRGGRDVAAAIDGRSRGGEREYSRVSGREKSRGGRDVAAAIDGRSQR